MSITRYDYLLDTSSNFTEKEKTDLCTQFDEIPVRFINCMVRGNWKVKRKDNMSANGNTDIETRTINLQSKCLLNPWKVLAHEIIHVVDFQSYIEGEGFIHKRADFQNLYDTEKPKLIASGNSMWVSNDQEFLGYICAAIITNTDRVPFQYSPNSEVWARNFTMAQPLPVPVKLESLEKGKVENITYDSATNKIKFFKGGIEHLIQLQSGGSGSSNIIWDNAVTEDTNIQTFQENTLTYSYKDGEGVTSSILLMTYCGVGKMDFYQLKHEINAQLSTSPVIKHRNGDRYGWQGWEPLGGEGSSYTLPVATASTLGGITMGDNVLIEADGTLSVETATNTVKGVAKFNQSYFDVTDGLVSIKDLFALSVHNHDNNYASKTHSHNDYALKDKTIVTKTITGGLLTLSTDEYQKCTMLDATEIKLPTVTAYTQIELHFSTTSDLTLIFPNVSWQAIPSIKANKNYVVIFTYNGTKWLGGCVEYGS